MDQFAHVNSIRLHYLDHPGEEPPLVLIPGLSANAHAFDGLIGAGLSPRFRVLALDMRGRGLSDQPQAGYTMADHAADVIGLLDHMEIEQAIVGGHSFGGLLTIYMGVHFPDRVAKCIVLDAGLLHPEVFSLIGPSIARLGKIWPSFEAYLADVRAQPAFAEGWDDAIKSYYWADVETLENGTVTPRSRPETIAQAGAGVQAEPWTDLIGRLSQPTLLVNGPGPYGPSGAPAVQPEEQGRATAELMPNARYVKVPGNHMTMLYGDGAMEITIAINNFVRFD